MDTDPSSKVNAYVAEDMRRLGVTIIMVIIVIALVASIQAKTGFITKLFPFQVANQAVNIAAPSPVSPSPAK
jgi:hypothetical protein